MFISVVQGSMKFFCCFILFAFYILNSYVLLITQLLVNMKIDIYEFLIDLSEIHILFQ